MVMNIKIKKLLTTFLFFLLTLILIPSSVLATTFDLIAPTGELIRGQNVQFTINIDTEGESFSSTSIGMTYETKDLEYVSVSPGNTFTTVSSDVQGLGKFIITGTSATPYSGSGAYAYVTYKIIATGPGETQLCALYNPLTTPTPGPSSTPGGPTSPPAPTSLPPTGESKSAVQGAILASLFFAAAGVSLFVFKKT